MQFLWIVEPIGNSMSIALQQLTCSPSESYQSVALGILEISVLKDWQRRSPSRPACSSAYAHRSDSKERKNTCTKVINLRTGPGSENSNRPSLATRTSSSPAYSTWLCAKHWADISMSKLVFVSHEAADGRQSSAKKALIHAHTLQYNRRKSKRLPPSSSVKAHLHKDLADRTRSSDTRLDVALSEESLDSNLDTDGPPVLSSSVVHASHVSPCHDYLHATISAPIRMTIFGPNGEDVQSIGQWYFHNQLDGVRSFHFDHAQTHWTNALWDAARVNKPMFAAIGAFALHKELTLAKRRSNSAYLEQKGRTIWHISNDLRQPHCASDPLTMVAVALLAYMDMRDGNFAAAKTHLEAVRDLIPVSTMPAYAWLHCAWVDIRYALLTGQAPIIPRHIPPSLRRDTSNRSPQNARMASENVANCPQAAFFTHQIAFELFDRLHALCCHPNKFDALEPPPFGQIYDLEYSLRTIQSQVSENELRERSAPAVELVLLTIQLHVWMACRFWTPQRRESHLAVVSRACSVLNTFQNIAARWLDFGSAESLLWVLFTMTASVHIHAHSYRERLFSLLRPILSLLDIQCHNDFSEQLHKWPWVEDWHPTHTRTVWSDLSARTEDLAAQRPCSQIVATPGTLKRTEERLFLGILEFYNDP
jgi:hypothetical protein